MKIFKKIFSALLTLGISISAVGCFNPGGNGPTGCIGSLAYILSPNRSEMYVFDISNSRVVASQRTGRNPMGIAASPLTNQIYVTNYTDGTISVFQAKDGQTYSQQATIGSGMGPMGIATNVRWNEFYVVYEGDAKVVVFDTSMENYGKEPYVKYTIPISAQDKQATPRKVAINPNGDRLYITDKDRVYSITRSQDGSFTQPTPSQSFGVTNDFSLDLQGIVVAPNGAVYIANSRKDEVIIFDPATNRPTGQISLKDTSLGNKSIRPMNMAISADGARLFVTGQDASIVSVVDLQTKRLLRNIPLVRGTQSDAYNPTGIAISMDQYGQEMAYVTNAQGRNLSVINASASILDLDRNTSTHTSVSDQPPLGEIIIPCSVRFNAVTQPVQ